MGDIKILIEVFRQVEIVHLLNKETACVLKNRTI